MTVFESQGEHYSNQSPWGPLVVRWLLVGLTFLLATFELADYDIWWHLRTGQLIQERQAVPDKDWYSFTATDRDWLDVHWGFQVLFSWLHSQFGVPGLVLAKATIASLAVAIALTAYRPTWSPTVQVVIWLPALLLMSSRFYVRPEILTLLFTAIFLTVLFHAEERPGWLWLLPIVQVAWSNVQGLFAFGPILIGMYLVEAVLRAGKTRGLWRNLIPVSLLVPAACLASPYGIRNVLFVVELWSKMQPKEDLFRKHIAELQDFPTFWNQGGFVNPYAILFVLVGCIAGISLLLALVKIVCDRRAFWVLAAIGFGYLGIRAIRNGNHFAMVVGTVATWCLGSLTESSRRPRLIGSLVSACLVLGMAFAVVSGRWYLLASPDRKLGLENRASFNSPAAMRLAGAEGMPERAAIFNLGHAAEYIYFNGPQRRVLFDGRLEVYSDQQFREYIELENTINDSGDAGNRANWDAHLHGQGCDLVIVDSEHNHPMQAAVWAHPMWRCVHYDEVLAVFLRRSFSAPSGIGEFSFSAGLFKDSAEPETRSLPQVGLAPTWTIFPPPEATRSQADFLAERSGYLGLGMMNRPTIPPSVRLANAAFSLQFADAAARRRPWAAEARRFRGTGSYLAAFAIDPAVQIDSIQKPWTPDTGLLLAQSATAFRQALKCQADDYSANFYLFTFAKQSGLWDEAETLLARVRTITASNVARQRMQSDIAKETEDLRPKLSPSPPDLNLDDARFENLTRLAQVGLLAKALRQFDVASVANLSTAQVDRVGTWLLQMGEAEQALEVYLAMRPSDAGGGLRELRIGQCRLLMGTYAEADSDLAKAPASYERCFAQAWVAILRRDRAGLLEVVKEANSLKMTDEQRRRLELLTELAYSKDAQKPERRPAP